VPLPAGPETGEAQVPIRVLIADDHGVVRHGLKMYMADDPDFLVVGEARTGREAVTLALELQPDVVLMDLVMPELDGISATMEIRANLPNTEVIAMTSVLEDGSVAGAVRAGAIGYLLKDTQEEDLLRMIKAAAGGQIQISPEAATRLVKDVRAPQPHEPLTDRETEVLQLVAQGKANKEIARLLDIGENTVKTHVRRILVKLNMQSRTQAAIFALQSGMAPGASSSARDA
jgi:DNA-binding NarL/FixJ family response regulator